MRKRETEKKTRERLADLRKEHDSEVQRLKDDLKKKLQAQHDREMDKLSHELLDANADLKRKCEDQSEQKTYLLET